MYAYMGGGGGGGISRYVCVCEWVRERVCVSEWVRVCVHVCVKGVEGTRVFASPALVVVAVCMAVHLTSYSDYLTSFCEPLSPPYRSMSHWFEKKVWCDHWWFSPCVTDGGVQAVTKGQDKLCVLELKKLPKLTALGLTALRSPSLWTVTMKNCPMITCDGKWIVLWLLATVD